MWCIYFPFPLVFFSHFFFDFPLFPSSHFPPAVSWVFFSVSSFLFTSSSVFSLRPHIHPSPLCTSLLLFFFLLSFFFLMSSGPPFLNLYIYLSWFHYSILLDVFLFSFFFYLNPHCSPFSCLLSIDSLSSYSAFLHSQFPYFNFL